MTTNDIPHTSPLDTPSTSRLVEESKQPAFLQRDDVSEYVKQLVLGHLVKRSIKQNEAQSIITGVEIVDMQSRRTIVSHGGNTEHFAASINKLPVTLLVMEDLRRGALRKDQVLTWQPSDVRGGAGVYDQPGAPSSASVYELLEDLLKRSGNTAVRVLVNQGLGGAPAVNERWAQKPELAHTRLQPLPGEGQRFYVGNSTAKESLWSLEQVVKPKDPLAAFIKQALKTNIYTDISVRSQLAGNDYIVLVNKVGLLDDVEGNNRHDVGIVYNTRTGKHYGYSFFTTSPYDREGATFRAEQSLKDMGRYTLRFSGDKKHREAPAAELHRADTRATQRILY